MNPVNWSKGFMRITDIYGRENEIDHQQKTDVIIYSQLPEVIKKGVSKTLHKRFKTLHIDLTKSTEQLRSEMNRSTRYQVNRAVRDNVKVEIIEIPSDIDIQSFGVFFNEFAKEKKIGSCNISKLISLRDKNQLVITRVTDENGRLLSSHGYSTDGVKACMIYSCSARLLDDSIDKSIIGRANRHLHWQDMMYFKDQGYQIYDFCGLTQEDNDEEKNIDYFKKGFGGEEVIEYKCYEAKSLLGTLVLYALSKRWKARSDFIQFNM
ncbi:hypothetical protein [Pseudalkalibacillus berkeleyi]|uniref:Lipid II:glycine glycyltransferase n=1 Tax=Pseudalkalibacillus berkeleyi TaxID=1069813 RepID=A0ABS9H4G2_9BACL|nr:hypothetical protein [Pseudalkalibacillus berkeleyi]MCF6138727.1 hypothetical protein [Pseudalkalibacillus berkeleyi]